MSEIEIERYDRDLFKAHDGEFCKYDDFVYYVQVLEAEHAVSQARCRELEKQVATLKNDCEGCHRFENRFNFEKDGKG